jgi:hypothetical protein
LFRRWLGPTWRPMIRQRQWLHKQQLSGYLNESADDLGEDQAAGREQHADSVGFPADAADEEE